MKNFLAPIIALLLAGPVFAGEISESTERFGPFGQLHLYQTSAQPKHVVLFISGDGGWNLGVIDMAKFLAELDSMVVGIDITYYLRQLDARNAKCSYPAAHFEELSQYLQKKHHFPHYIQPVLTGYSSGATLAYATLAQSPPNTFAGGISMGFCPDLKTAKPLCKGSGVLSGTFDARLGYIYNPVPALASRLFVLQGDADQVCSTPQTRAFLSKISNAELIELPRVGHGFSVQKNWMPQFKDAFQKIVAARPVQITPEDKPEEISDLPLVALPADHKSDTLAVIISGDGGWAGIDKQVAEALNREGIHVVGLDSLQYFWEQKNPDIAGADLARILNHYGKAWGADKFILIGYSSGADTLPFMVSRLPEPLKTRVHRIALLGVANQANFEFHVSDWLVDAQGMYQVIPEIQKLKGMNLLCIYGEDEADSACRSLDKAGFSIVEMKGGHHFSGDYESLVNIILEKSR